MDTYEKQLALISINAGEKIIDAAVLYKTGYSYRDAWFLTIIAEEELAKLVLLPFAKLAGNLDELMQRPSAYYKHPVKHKIFISYGLQNRSPAEIESIKQASLYIGTSDDANLAARGIKKQQVFDELVRAIRLFDQLALRNISIARTPSKALKTTVNQFGNKILAPAIHDLVPDIAEQLSRDLSGLSESMTIFEAVEQHPLLFTEMLVYSLPTNYQKFFREIQGLSYHEMLQKLRDYLE